MCMVQKKSLIVMNVPELPIQRAVFQLSKLGFKFFPFTFGAKFRKRCIIENINIFLHII
jgi:hypothetical protein